MISEKVKQYCICEDCCKSDKCEYYDKIEGILNEYKDTPLYLHFANCDEYKNVLIELIEISEKNNKIAEKIKIDDKEDFVSKLLKFNIEAMNKNNIK